MILRHLRQSVFLCCFLLSASVSHSAPDSLKLGSVDFPTSGASEAQSHFLVGVAALHSFWYPEALDAFKKATQADPAFAMGYWGQAMAHNHPLWESQETEAARAALDKIRDTAHLTAREQAYIEAVRRLYGGGDKPARDQNYLNAMERIYRDYPDDLEAACFYSLALQGAARGVTDKLRLQVRAGAIAMEVFRQNPDHPCAAHYTIHAFDDPDLAILALPAARRYAQIAPDAHHALHMPSHIFVQLGMWEDAAASNEAAWASSTAWVERKGLPLGERSYHELQWLQYVYLQQGRYEKADALFQIKLQDMNSVFQDPKADAREKKDVSKYFEEMLGASIIETERWERAKSIKPPEGWTTKGYFEGLYRFILGFAAARSGDTEEAELHLKALNAVRSKGIKENYFLRKEALDIWALEIEAALRLHEKQYDEAVQRMEQARTLEESLPAPSGPPRLIKPTHEFLAEILLAAGKPKEAFEQFTQALQRQPGRARSLLGATRAAKRAGDPTRTADWAHRLLSNWQQADTDLPDLQETRNYRK